MYGLYGLNHHTGEITGGVTEARRTDGRTDKGKIGLLSFWSVRSWVSQFACVEKNEKYEVWTCPISPGERTTNIIVNPLFWTLWEYKNIEVKFRFIGISATLPLLFEPLNTLKKMQFLLLLPFLLLLEEIASIRNGFLVKTKNGKTYLAFKKLKNNINGKTALLH